MGNTSDVGAFGDVPAAHAEHVHALSRLALLGWWGTLVGDPAGPEALIYVHDRDVFRDAVLVYGPDDAYGVRTSTFGRTLRSARGSVADVVGDVLTW